MQTIKKLVASGMILSTVLSLVVVAAPTKAASAQAGDLIKMSGLSSVYYLGADQKRYVFPNEATYKSWYSDYSGVKTIPQAELESYMLGANVTIRPGTKLVKITTNPKVYAVEPGGSLVAIPDEATAKALYGDSWAKRVVDVADAFFTNYKISTKIASATAAPAGSLVKVAGDSSVYYVNTDGKAQKIVTEDAFKANRFSFDNVLTIATLPAAGSDISGVISNISDTSAGAGGSANAGSGLTVALSGTTAASATVIAGQALADIASFNLTAANDGAVKVTSIKLKRTGVSGDTILDNIYLYDGATRLTDGGTFSSGVVTFNNGTGLFTVEKGATKTITVKGDVYGSATSGTFGVSVNAASDIVTDGASVTGSFPAAGNVQSVVAPDASTLGTVTMNAAPISVGSSVNAGTNQVVLWNATLNAGVKYSNLKYLKVKQIGSAPYDAIQNVKLFVDGVQVGTTVALANTDSTYSFDLASSPAKLDTGSHSVELRGDVVKGSSRNFLFSIETKSDIVINESGYGINVAVGGTATVPYKPATSTTINSGSLSISTDSTLNTTQVVKGSSNVALARYTVKAYGEDIKVKTLNVVTQLTGTSSNTEGLSNVSLYVNNAQVGSSKNALETGVVVNPTHTLTFGTTNLFTVPAGTTVTLEIRADLTQVSASQITKADANLQVLADSAQGVASANTTPSATANYAGQAALSIVSGSLTVSKATDFQSQNALINSTKLKIGSFKLQASNAEDVAITSLSVALAGDVNTNDLTNLTVAYKPDNAATETTLDPVQPQSTNNFSTSISIPANGYETVNVYVDLGSNPQVGTTTISKLTVNFRGSKTNTSQASSQVTGQTITVQSGSLATPTLVSSDAPSKMVAGGTTDKIGSYKFVATNGAATLQELWFQVTASTSAITAVTVAGQTGTVYFDGANYVAHVTGLNITVPAGSTGYTVPVNASYNTVTSAGQGGIATRATAGLSLVHYKSQISNTVSETDVNVPANAMYVVASVPVVDKAADSPSQSTGFAGGNTDVYHFTVTAPAGQPAILKAVGVTPVYSGTLSSTTNQYVKIYASTDLNTPLGSAVIGASGVQESVVFTNDYTIDAGTTKTFVVYADATGLSGTGNSFRLDLTASNDTGLATGSDWQWNDTTVSGIYGNGFLLKNLPKTGGVFAK